MKNSLMTLALLLVTSAALAETTATAPQTRRRAPDAPIVGTVDDLAWLSGRWTGNGLGGETEEIWSPPDGGAMIGVFRLIRDGKPVFYEFITIRMTDRGLAMQLKHFNPDMTAWEEKEKFVEFLYVGREDNRYFFEGLTFIRESADALTIWLALRGKDGTVREQKFEMRRR